jgi:YbbR domain-containing protein
VEQAYQAGLIRVECVAAPEENKGDSQDVRVQLKGVNLSAPKALAIRWISFEPSEIEVRLVRETTGDVPVIPRLSTPPLGYEVTYKAPGRATVVLRGRKDVIAALTKTGIATEEIDISVPPPPYATEWTLTPFARIPSHVIFQGVKCPITCEERVQCTVVLVQKAIEKTFTSIPIRLLFPPEYPYEASLRERTTDVKIRGPAGIVNNVKPQNIVLYVDVSDLKPQELRDTQRIEAQIVNVPGGTELTIKPAIPTCAVKITEPRTAGK